MLGKSEVTYFGSDRSRAIIATIGVEISQYCDDVEAVVIHTQPERLPELEALVDFMTAHYPDGVYSHD